ETDASPIQSGSAREKFLFYRGVGRFAPPIAATVEPDGRIVVRSPAGGALGDIILFERRGDSVAYDVRHVDGSQARFATTTPHDNSSALLAELERILVASGLYPREAK